MREVAFGDAPNLRALLIPIVVMITNNSTLQSQTDSSGEHYVYRILKTGLQLRCDLVGLIFLTLEVEGIVVRGA